MTLENKKLEGRLALVTGGARGIGKAIAKELSAQGATVIIADKRVELLEETKKDLETEGATVYAREIDVRKRDSVESVFVWAQKELGVMDILINNAGVCYAHPFLERDEQAYTDTIDTNLKGTLQTSEIFAKQLIAAEKQGSIVNLSSNAYKRPYERYVEYNATKAAVANLTHTLSQELAPYDINVNAVCPGAVDTKMLRYCMEEVITGSEGAVTLEECRATWGPRQLQRLVRPEEIGKVVAFLAGPDARIIRGQAIQVDGGDTAL